MMAWYLEMKLELILELIGWCGNWAWFVCFEAFLWRIYEQYRLIVGIESARDAIKFIVFISTIV
jgi:hypothetical protein